MYRPVALSPESIEKLVSAGSGTAALLLLHLMGGGGVRAAAAAMRSSERDVEEAHSLLAKLDLLPRKSEENGDSPAYSSDELAAARGHPVFESLVCETERRLGRRLPVADLTALYEIYDWVGLQPGVISLLVAHGIEETRERYGPGRMPTMRALRRMALDWVREGLRTPEDAERYLGKLHDRRRMSGKMARALQIGGRDLSPTEQKYIAEWQGMGFDDRTVSLAYDKAVIATGQRTWRYIHSILTRWHAAGLHSPDEIAKGDAPPRERTEKKGAGSLSSIELEAMRRLRDGEEG